MFAQREEVWVFSDPTWWATISIHVHCSRPGQSWAQRAVYTPSWLGRGGIYTTPGPRMGLARSSGYA
eukprot:473286-Pyramimonas_sp.AAC.1